jgi:hypothetical protein
MRKKLSGSSPSWSLARRTQYPRWDLRSTGQLTLQQAASASPLFFSVRGRVQFCYGLESPHLCPTSRQALSCGESGSVFTLEGTIMATPWCFLRNFRDR